MIRNLTNAVLTIGHSNHSWDAFSALLTRHLTSVVADVRSAPYSRFAPHFNRETLAQALDGIRIDYHYFGRELGGRPGDPACYEGGRVCYERVASTQIFRSGISRLVAASARQQVVLMCAEKDPLDCHRALLIAQALDEQAVDVEHILADGRLERHSECMDRLLTKHNLSLDGDLVTPRAEFVATAIERQTRYVGYVDPCSPTATG